MADKAVNIFLSSIPIYTNESLYIRVFALLLGLEPITINNNYFDE